MEPTFNQPYSGATDSTSYADTTASADSQFSTTAAHATGDSPYPTDSATPTGSIHDRMNDALASGKKWLTDSGLADQAQQLPQVAKDLGTKAWARINGLSNTQKAVGVGLLAAGVAFLATRSNRSHDDEGEYRHKPRRSPFSKKPFGEADDSYAKNSRRPWGSSRYGSASGSRVSSGSGYSSSSHSADFGRDSSESSRSGSGQRRDQGPSAAGSRYNSRTSGSQNPNNSDELSSAF